MFEKHRVKLFPNGYENFDQKTEAFHDVGEFSWEFQGYDLYSKYLPELAESIHNGLSYALQMTKNTYGDKTQNIDTSYFRQAVSVYLAQIHGIRDDQFNYSIVNKVLQVVQKIYIKKIGCAP